MSQIEFLGRIEFLGIEGGGTRTVAVVVNEAGKAIRRAEFPAGNIRLLNREQLMKLFGTIAQFCRNPAGIGAGMAGIREEADRRKVRKAVEGTWGSIPAVITHDLEIALAASGPEQKRDAEGARAEQTDAKVLVLSGTGSCCYGRKGALSAKVGGWGHLLGDIGSGYAIAHAALREVVYHFDRHGKWGALGRRILRELLLNEPGDLIAWVQEASKSEIASVARCVFAAQKDPLAASILKRTAEALAKDALLCAAKLGKRSGPVLFVLAGGVLLGQPEFARRVGLAISRGWRGAQITLLRNEGAHGAAELARQAAGSKPRGKASTPPASRYYIPEFVPQDSPTEQRNPASTRFHELTTRESVEMMLNAEKRVIPALLRERAQIVRAVDLAASTLKKGGRILYVGAGTSGRLGVLDASECPPTFRASPELIQGIIAGGQRALWQAVEGAEDDPAAGANALAFRKVTSRDLVIGIAASGRTPFVWGAIGLAKKAGARTILLCFNPSLKIAREHRPDLIIAPNAGPEILTGSTRLKSGTATKLVLNMISTISMVRQGKVIGNLMVDLNPSNIKLRDRAVRILQDLTGCDSSEARAALESSGWVVKMAWAKLNKGRLTSRK